ncbi:uncharacterized protein LOC125568050 [Nematostella vectensis]|uniref:uncharacterized protein LOC125568050 n=1 Tax=Nematostella vectensis TaxID=45351 RepID=UPI0020770104|nr:uncharacterized protein LOC125568050 [Nematostella vectensis]
MGKSAESKEKTKRDLIKRLTTLEDSLKERDGKILELEGQLDVAFNKIKVVVGELQRIDNDLIQNVNDSDELRERTEECERRQANNTDELVRQSLYSRRWNLIVYKLTEAPEEDCEKLVKGELVRRLKLGAKEVEEMKLCGVHRLGKQSRGKIRPIILRFTCRADREKVWKARYNLKGQTISIGEDVTRQRQ